MTPQKPKVPKNEVYNVYYEKTFFGDEQAQARAVETITRGLGENTGKIYIIAGPIRSGKGTVYQRLLEQPADMLPEIDFFESEFPPSNMTAESKGVWVMLPDVGHSNWDETLQQAKAFIQSHPHANVLIDALTYDPLLPLDLPKQKQQEFGAQREKIEAACANDSQLVFASTQYGLAAIKNSLWEIHEQLAQRYFATGDAIAGEWFADYRGNNRITPIIRALNKGDREAYDRAFQMLEKPLAISRAGP